MISAYNKNVDFLRFLFAIIIVIFHMCHNNLVSIYGSFHEYNVLGKSTLRAWILVEFFFIISGYFLWNTPFDKMSHKEFVWKKIVRLWPIFAVATLCETFPHFSLTTIMKLLFFQCNGFSLEYKGINWFVSSLFWTLLFYFSLIKIINKRYIVFVISVMVYFSYVYLINYGFGREVKGLFSIGMVRGIAGVGLGYLFHEFCTQINPDAFNKRYMYFIFSILEIILLGFFIYCFTVHNIKNTNNFIFIVLFLPLMFSFIFNLGWLSKLLDNNFSVVLGRYSYALYVMQQTSFSISCYILKKISVNFIVGFIIALFISICLAFLTQNMVDFIFNRYHKNRVIQKIN